MALIKAARIMARKGSNPTMQPMIMMMTSSRRLMARLTMKRMSILHGKLRVVSV